MYTGRAALQKGEVGSSSNAASSFASVLSSTACPTTNFEREPASKITKTLAKPFIQMLLYKGVVLQLRIESAHPVDFIDLAWGKFLIWIETPSPFEQPLASQDLMNSGNASTKLIGRVEDCGIRVGDLLGQSELFAWDRLGIVFRHREMRNRDLCPHGPMPKQSTHNSYPLIVEIKCRKQVSQNVVVISGVQGNLLGTPRMGQCAYHIDGLVAIEWCNLNGNHVLDLKETTP